MIINRGRGTAEEWPAGREAGHFIKPFKKAGAPLLLLFMVSASAAAGAAAAKDPSGKGLGEGFAQTAAAAPRAEGILPDDGAAKALPSSNGWSAPFARTDISRAAKVSSMLEFSQAEAEAGETDMIRALKNRDIEGFKAALKKGIFEEPALKFLKDWHVLTEEKTSAAILLAEMRLSGPEERAAASRALYELLRLFSFPESDRAESHAGLTFQKRRIFLPLERASLHRAAADRNFEAFVKGLEDLLAGPANRLLAELHAVTWSRMTLKGIINQKLDRKSAAIWNALLQEVRFAFQRPLLRYSPTVGGLSPKQAAKKAGNREMYYALRHFSREDEVTQGLIYALVLGAGGAVGAGSDFLWSAFNGPPLSQQAAAAAAYGPVALSGAGIACYRVFKWTRQRGIIRQLEKSLSKKTPALKKL